MIEYNPEHYISWVEPWPDGARNLGVQYVEITCGEMVRQQRAALPSVHMTDAEIIEDAIPIHFAEVHRLSISDRLRKESYK